MAGIRISLILILLCGIVGCASVATREEFINGELIIVERLTLKGLKSNKEAKFTSKASIQDKSALAFPDIDVDLDKLKD